MDHFDETRGARLQAALEAALAAKNPTLVRSIRAAMDGRVVDPLEGLSLHPEVDHLWRYPGSE
jgi:hypothetical protein